MLLETMTTDELRYALISDVYWLSRYIEKFKMSMRRVQRRMKNKNGRYSEWARHPKSMNEWLLAGYYFGDSYEVYPYCFYQAKEGGYLLRPFSDGTLNKFTPHFFIRYKERMSLNYNDTRKIMGHFARRTIDGHYMPQSVEEFEKFKQDQMYRFFNIMLNGVGLGDYWPNERVFHVRTFVSNEMLFRDQEHMRDFLTDAMKDAYEQELKKNNIIGAYKLAIQLRNLYRANVEFARMRLKDFEELEKKNVKSRKKLSKTS